MDICILALLQLEKIDKFVLAACVLHNIGLNTAKLFQENGVYSRTLGLMPVSNNISGNNYSREAAHVR